MRSSISTVTYLPNLHIYKGLYGKRYRAENCEKLLLNFNKYCLPELQWCFFARSVWFSSGFVLAFPSSYSSTVSLFQNRYNYFLIYIGLDKTFHKMRSS